MTKIYLYLNEQTDSWMVEMSRSSRADEIQRLFGTSQIPTAYTIRTGLDQVLKSLQTLNPNDLITASYSEFVKE